MRLGEYARYDGLALSELVKRRQVSRLELAECSLAAIEAMNPQLNAVIEHYPVAVEQLNTGADVGNRPFDGVPFLLKDIGSHDANVTYELGSRLTKGLRAPSFPSELVRRFRESGVTILGRTNVPELGSSFTTEPVLYGPTRNPWGLEHTAGGSSGGAAAAVASGMVPIAHAADSGGSIRWPAACCGVFGLKPSRNLNPVGPDAALPLHGCVAEHVISRTVRDSAAMLDATAGPDVGAWCFTPRLSGSYLAEIYRPAGKLRLGVNLKALFPPTALQREVIDATWNAARLCESLGHHVEEAAFEFDCESLLRAYYVLWISELRQGIETLSAVTGRQPSLETLEPHNFAAYTAAKNLTATQLQAAFGNLNTVARAYGAYFERYDVMLTPAGSMAPFRLGRLTAIDTTCLYDWYRAMTSYCPFTVTVNMAGIPAMSVPLAHNEGGLPIGSHFIAAMGQESLLLRLASQLEAARPWINRTPAIHASALVL